MIAEFVGHRTDLDLGYSDGGTYRTTAAFSSDGRRVVTGSQDKTARIWDVETGKQLTLIAGHGERVNNAIFSADGRRILTASDDNTARIWDAQTGRQILMFYGHKRSVQSAVFSPDGRRVLTGSADGTARVWDAQTGKQVLQVTSRSAAFMTSAEFSPDGYRIATLTLEGDFQIWNAQSGDQILLFAAPQEGAGSAKFSPDGRKIVATASRTIWSTEPTVLPYHTAEVDAAKFNPDGRRFVTASDDSTARIWDSSNVSAVSILLGHGGPVRDASFSLDGKRVVTASADKTAKIWDAETGKLITTLSGHNGEVNAAAFSPDGLRVVTGSSIAPVPTDNTARLWDAQTGRQIAVLQHRDGAFASFSPDGRQLLTTSFDKTARIWDAFTGKQLLEFENVERASSSPRGKRVMLKQGASAIIRDSETGREIALLQAIKSIEFTRDGRRIMGLTTDNAVRAWDAETGKIIDTFGKTVASATLSSFSPDGGLALMDISGEGLLVWDIHSDRPLTLLTGGGTDSVNYGDFSTDGKRVLTTGSYARLWSLPSKSQDIIDESRNTLLRCLTPAQRSQYFLDRDPPAWCTRSGKWPYERN